MRGVILTCALLMAAAAFAEPVPFAPTAADAVPAAILGKGSTPLGTAVGYFPASPKTKGYLTIPAGSGKHGAVILIHEWDGLGERVRQVADAFAAEDRKSVV